MMREAYTISSLLTMVVTVFLGSIIYLRGRGGRITRSYFSLMAFVALWSAGILNLVTSESSQEAIIWTRILFACAAFIPCFYFRFIVKLLKAEKQYKFLLRLGYCISFCFALVVAGPSMFKGIRREFNAYWPVAGKFFWLYIFYFAFYPLLAHAITFDLRKSLTHLARKQLLYITIAAVFGFGGGASTFLPCYGIFMPKLQSIAIFSIPFACSFMAIATYTVRLVDIEVFKRRAFIFSLLYGLSIGLFVCIVFIAQHILMLKYNINRFVFPVSALFLITFFIRPLEHLLVRLTDKFLYQKKYNYLSILEEANKGMLFITDIDKLLKLITRMLSKHMRVTHAAVYLYDKDSDAYVCRAVRNKSIEIQKQIQPSMVLVEWLREKRAPLLNDDITNWLQKEMMFPHRAILKRTLEQLRVAMRLLKGAVCVPAFIRADLIGFLVLGDKLSGAAFNRDDIVLLSTLSNSAAIAIENAYMYEELRVRIKRVAQLYKDQHELFIDTATAFSYAVDLRDAYSRQHTQRIIDYCMIILRGLDKMNAGYSKEPDFLESLKVAALLHDVGKVAIPDSILNKKGSLTPEEYDIVRNHINIAVDILKPITELASVIRIIKYHHEFYNGKGYPEGLDGDKIPFASRILAVANAYDAMTSDRPYRQAMSHQRTAELLKKGAGEEFDPVMAQAMLLGFEGVGTTIKGEARTSRGEVPPVLY
ncbi:MAG: HD domain-containing phosphohydrolase [Candidatus Omnitrophota bacterium]